MSTSTEKSVWASGGAYEPYVGPGSRLVAREFVEWLAIPSGARWLDVGCGTGALTPTVIAWQCQTKPILRWRIRSDRIGPHGSPHRTE